MGRADRDEPTEDTGGSSSAEASSLGQDEDTVEISPEADAHAQSGTDSRTTPEATTRLPGQLSEEQQQVVQELKTIDRKVRAHEQAHVAAAGPYAKGGPSYEYATGPDGQQYAVGGEVAIDISPVPDDPEATIRKAEVIRAAAMAPADPSGQDCQVAAAAAKMEVQAQQELLSQQQSEQQGGAAGANDSATDTRGTLFDAVA
jgi:hypothetical protein